VRGVALNGREFVHKKLIQRPRNRSAPERAEDLGGLQRVTENEQRTRLIGWLEVIYKDVADLVTDNYLFWELQAIVRNNVKMRESSGLFTQWMASSFVQATAVGVRRQAKDRDDSVSLKRFLVEVQKYPALVSRDHYISLFDGKQAWLVEKGQRDFDHIAGSAQAHILPTLPAQHLRELEAAVQPIEHYVDRRVAHYDPRGLTQPIPRFDDLSNALATLERLVAFYWFPLKGGDKQDTLLPTDIDDDWKDVFRFPWEPLPTG